MKVQIFSVNPFSRITASALVEFYADQYEVYTALVPPAQFVQSKAETYTIEGQNRLIRHFLARFKRQSFCD